MGKLSTDVGVESVDGSRMGDKSSMFIFIYTGGCRSQSRSAGESEEDTLSQRIRSTAGHHDHSEKSNGDPERRKGFKN